MIENTNRESCGFVGVVIQYPNLLGIELYYIVV